MADFHLDRALSKAFVTGRLDAQGQATLAEQVARVIPVHAQLPNPIVARLSRIADHLGGEEALLAWLDSRPGRPRLVARLFLLIGLLDRFSADPAVVTALREFRACTKFPAGLEDYLPPHTDDGTLASLAWEIESLLGDDRANEAVQLALATVAMLQEIAPRAGELDSTFATWSTYSSRHGTTYWRRLKAASRPASRDGPVGAARRRGDMRRPAG